MAIEITEFANVSIAVSPVGINSGNFGILGFLTNEEGVIGHPERGRSYTSLASVGEDWSADTEVYKAATAFYGQTPTPVDFLVINAYETAQPAKLVGGVHKDITDLLTIAGDGVLDITIDGTDINLNTIDFSGATTLEEVAAVINTEIDGIVTGATCDYSQGMFLITSPTTGINSTISYGTGNVADALGLSVALGKASNGIDIETPVDALASALSMGIKPVGLVTHKKYRDKLVEGDGENTLDIASWCEGAKVIFCNTTNSLSTLSSVIDTDIASTMKSASLMYTLTTFSRNDKLYPSAAVFGRAASTNFSAVASTITLNLKQMAGIVAEDLSPNEFNVLRSKNASAVVNIANSVNAYTDSKMANGSWLDTVHGLMWLEDRCEVDMFNFLYQTATKVPYTQSGINSCANTLRSSLEAAVRNGLAGPGFLSDGTYLPDGYEVITVDLSDVPSSDKSNRIYKGLSFQMVGAGSLHQVEVSGTFTE